jgi:DNA-binding CsgD family transcriptional regulator
VIGDDAGGLAGHPADDARRTDARELVAALRARRDGGERRPVTSCLVDLARASRRLRLISRPTAMLTAGCEEAATVSGLERTVISALGDRTDRPVVKAAHGPVEAAEDDVVLEREFDCGHAEVDALARAAPMTVVAPSPPHQIGSVVGHPHVVVPVMHDGRAIGLLHGAHDDGREIGEVAIAGLTAFAAMLSTLWYCAAIETSWHDHVQAVRRSVAENLDRLTIEPADDLGPLDAADEDAERQIGPGRVADDLCGRSLTPREKVVLRHLLDGASNRDIADELVLTVDTVKSHVKRILRKTGAANRAELIHRAQRPSPR